ncbi:Protein of unknown function [Pyronema omphalodes CBS 100304]|uniref:Uncharacterized protein n=1 Tax=Pyronema omphalodes (strain CBS 100304) TaxID=1076935 RepID=U4KX01_PYROM|nr:Protein of unknown function [Pyronema omphalodes CBS 100304]
MGCGKLQKPVPDLRVIRGWCKISIGISSGPTWSDVSEKR